ncbi:hypothetical protein D3C83_89760 [compost metagenome]
MPGETDVVRLAAYSALEASSRRSKGTAIVCGTRQAMPPPMENAARKSGSGVPATMAWKARSAVTRWSRRPSR